MKLAARSNFVNLLHRPYYTEIENEDHSCSRNELARRLGSALRDLGLRLSDIGLVVIGSCGISLCAGDLRTAMIQEEWSEDTLINVCQCIEDESFEPLLNALHAVRSGTVELAVAVWLTGKRKSRHLSISAIALSSQRFGIQANYFGIARFGNTSLSGWFEGATDQAAYEGLVRWAVLNSINIADTSHISLRANSEIDVETLSYRLDAQPKKFSTHRSSSEVLGEAIRRTSDSRSVIICDVTAIGQVVTILVEPTN